MKDKFHCLSFRFAPRFLYRIICCSVKVMALSVVLTAECQQFAGANTKKEYGFIGQPDKTAGWTNEEKCVLCSLYDII